MYSHIQWSYPCEYLSPIATVLKCNRQRLHVNQYDVTAETLMAKNVPIWCRMRASFFHEKAEAH